MSVAQLPDEAPWYAQSSERLRFFLMLALALHALLLMAVTFDFPSPQPLAQTIEITLARFDDRTPPEAADFLAQSNQLGSGEAAQKVLPSTTERAEFEAESVQQQSALLTPTPADSPRPELQANRLQTEFSEQVADASEAHSGGDPLVSTTANSELKSTTQTEQQSAPAETQTGVSTSLLDRSMEIANLQAKLALELNRMAKMPKIERVNSASTSQHPDAEYIYAVIQKAESIGNLHYPDEARLKGLHGSVQLSITLNADGSIDDIKITGKSGYSILDSAAIRSLQMAAPFAPFTDEMRQRYDQLVLIRTWLYEREARIY